MTNVIISVDSQFANNVQIGEPITICFKCDCGKETPIFDKVEGEVHFSLSANFGSNLKFNCSCGKSFSLYSKKSRKQKINEILNEEICS